MGQYFRFGDVSNTTVAERVKVLWLDLVTKFGLDEEPSDILAIPSNTTLTKLRGIAEKADGVLLKRNNPHVGVFGKALDQAVAGEVPTTITTQSVPSKTQQVVGLSVGTLFLGGLAVLAVWNLVKT